MSEPCTEKRFLHDVRDHQMVVLRDDGVNRHIRFKKPGSGDMHFDLITWPGKLCYTGDMGTYVFQRLEDMFEFFRTDRVHSNPRGDTTLCINPSYWSEKLIAVSGRGEGYREFDAEAFSVRVKEAFDDFVGNEEPDAEAAAELWQELTNEVLSCADDGEIRAIDAARNFTTTVVEGFGMDDCWEWNCKSYTYHFMWCCYALAWGIKQYDDRAERAESSKEAVSA